MNIQYQARAEIFSSRTYMHGERIVQREKARVFIVGYTKKRSRLKRVY